MKVTQNTVLRRLAPVFAAAAVAFVPLAAEDSEAVSEDHALYTMGYAMARQLRLDIGFSEEQLDRIFEGMRAVAMGADDPEDFQAALQVAQGIYMGKMEEARAREEEERTRAAAENRAAAETFFAGLDADRKSVV